MKKKQDSYSPNSIMLFLCILLVLNILFFGQSLYVPASRINNLYVRSVVLSLMESLSHLSSLAKLDHLVPQAREYYVEKTGLAKHPSWDIRFYNKRNTLKEIEHSPVVAKETLVSEPLQKENVIGPPIDIEAPLSLEKASEITPDSAVSTVLAEKHTKDVPRSRVHSKENPLQVYMFGDSQVFSLGSGLSRLAGKNSPISVDFLAIHSSGFIRWDYYNWPEKLDDYLENHDVDALIIMLGMNDTQSFWNSKGEILKKYTPEWEEAYKEKCRKIIDRALMSVSKVYWLGMPLVKNATYNTSLDAIDALQRAVAEEYSPQLLVIYSIRDQIPGPKRGYTETFTSSSGTTIRAMSEDGSHFTVEGGQLVMKNLFVSLTKDFLFSEVPIAHGE